MPHEIAVLAAKRRLERDAAFRQLQSLSHQISLLTRGRLTLDSFKLDCAVRLQPVAAGEVRIVQTGPDEVTSVAAIVSPNQPLQRVLPEDFQDSALLVVGLDQGSIGAAGMAFAINKLGLSLSCRFDKFHRIVRDIKLALKHACNGVLNKA